jgi:hypothetical protein
MSSRDDIGRYKDDLDKGLIYTCNCGWFDKGHGDGRNAKTLWDKVLKEEPVYYQNGLNGYQVDFAETSKPYGVKLHEHLQKFFVKSGLSISDKKKVALAIFKEVSISFENLQGTGVKGFAGEVWGGSSFSEEDLVSDLIGFYRIVDGTDWKTLCKPVSVTASETIWDRDGGVGTHKNKTFTPKFHACNECPTSVFPQQYQSIPDIQKGELFLDFNKSIAVREKDYDLYFGNFKESRQGLLFQGIPSEVRLIVNGQETQRQFGHRALIKAARKAGIWLISDQTEYADKFYPPANFSTDVNYKMDWADTNRKKVSFGEFNQKRGQYLTYELNPSQIQELRKRKFLLP